MEVLLKSGCESRDPLVMAVPVVFFTVTEANRFFYTWGISLVVREGGCADRQVDGCVVDLSEHIYLTATTRRFRITAHI